MPHDHPAPAVSVLMPVYNGARFLAEAIDSIRGQTFADFEFVIVDDGSTDASPAILADHARMDPRIRVVSQANAGIVAALNRGLAECRAPLVARMDADDVSLPPRLERQRAFLEAHPRVAVVGTALQLVSETGAVGPEVRHATGQAAISRGLRRGNCLAHPTVMMRRGVVLAVGGYREFLRHAEDYDLWTRLVERHQLANLTECLLRYRVHGGQVSWGVAEAQVLGTLAVQGLARVRRRTGVEPSPLPSMPDRTFLNTLGFSPAEIDYATTACVANRMELCDSVGMAEQAGEARRTTLESAALRGGAITRRTITGIVAWQDFRAAVRTGRLPAAAGAFLRCAFAGVTDVPLMRIALRRWIIPDA